MTATVEQIKQLKPKDTAKALLAVCDAEVRQTARKTDFLNVTLVDKTGTIKGKIWDFSGEPPENGTVWSIDLEYSPFNGSPQLVVRNYEEVAKDNVDSGLFVDSLTPKQFAYYRKVFDSLVNRIKDKDLRDFVKFTVDYYPTYFSSTGAKANHHARLGGLLEHSCHVTQGALGLADSYKGTPKHDLIDYDLLIAGALLHDIAKIDTYTTENLVLDYTLQGILLLDYDISPAYLREAYIMAKRPISEARLLGLQHILVTHHGKEWSNKPPSMFSAWLIHAADISDAYTDKIAANLPEDGMVSQGRIWSLGNHAVDERKLV